MNTSERLRKFRFWIDKASVSLLYASHHVGEADAKELEWMRARIQEMVAKVYEETKEVES